MQDAVAVNNKIVQIQDFHKLVRNKKVVQCHGVFDLLHIGHIRHFKLAKSYGDVLVVTLTADKYVNKGPTRPAFNENLRAEFIASLSFVDFVIINNNPTAIELIETIRPSVYVKGAEYKDAANDLTNKIIDETEAVRAVGGRIEFTDDITFSSSTLLNKNFSPLPKESQSFLDDFRSKYSIDTIFQYFTKAEKLNVLVIGEAIVDIYNFSDVIGKSGKEPILVTKHKFEEKYAGGVIALANHLSEFCKRATCLTYLGEDAGYEDLIKNRLKSNVDMISVYKKNSPTIVKRRYLDEYLQQKLFEVYELNDDYFEDEQKEDFYQKLQKIVPEYDLVIIIDYGHGLLDERSIDYIVNNAKFLAVNTQSNASNHGYNCISKYTKANFVAVASRELQLNYRQKHLSIVEQLERLLKEHKYDAALVTAGNKGSYSCRTNEAPSSAPAFTMKIVDRVGAGDAVLALTSLFAYFNAPADLIAFIGNVVGAEAVGIMGNKDNIHKVSLMKHINHILK